MNDLDIHDPVGNAEIISIKYSKHPNESWEFYVGKDIMKGKHTITAIERNDYSFRRFGILSYVIYANSVPWKEVTCENVELTFKI